MTNTPNLSLPHLAAAQAQKHVTVNEALSLIDALAQMVITSVGATSPPATPAEGERHIIGAGATGAWTGWDNNIALFSGGAWLRLIPQVGWLAWDVTAGELLVWNGSVWASFVPNLQNLAGVGIGTSYDATNKLAVSAAATLLNHAGNGHQLKINKAATGDTASVLFQTNWSGRAELGTTGDDDWHVKVSPDGTNWNEALIADKTTGAVRFPAGVEHALSRKSMNSLIMTPGGAGQNSIWRFDVTRSANPQTAVISSIALDVITLTTATATWFFTNDQMENVSYLRIWNTTKVPEESAWVKRVNNPGTNTELQVLSASDISGWLATETIQLGEPASQIPTNVVAVDISPMMQSMLGVVFRQAGLLVKAGVALNAVAGNIGVTPTGANGSFSNVFAHMDGSLTTGQVTIPCTELSPISNSNLVFIRETDGGANTLNMGLVSVFGVWV